MDHRQNFAVVGILDGLVAYAGRGIYAASRALEPGTVFSVAWSESKAIREACETARLYRERGYRPMRRAG